MRNKCSRLLGPILSPTRGFNIKIWEAGGGPALATACREHLFRTYLTELITLFALCFVGKSIVQTFVFAGFRFDSHAAAPVPRRARCHLRNEQSRRAVCHCHAPLEHGHVQGTSRMRCQPSSPRNVRLRGSLGQAFLRCAWLCAVVPSSEGGPRPMAGPVN